MSVNLPLDDHVRLVPHELSRIGKAIATPAAGRCPRGRGSVLWGMSLRPRRGASCPGVSRSACPFHQQYRHNRRQRFFVVGSLIFWGLVKAKTFAALFPFFFMVSGFFLFRSGWKSAKHGAPGVPPGNRRSGEVYGAGSTGRSRSMATIRTSSPGTSRWKAASMKAPSPRSIPLSVPAPAASHSGCSMCLAIPGRIRSIRR